MRRYPMTSSRSRLAVAVCVTLLFAPAIVRPQTSEVQQRVAALKRSMAQDQQKIRQYEWVETTVVSVKGEEKSRKEQQCYYGADGALQKVPLSAAPPPEETRGLRGRVVAKKKEEIADYLAQAMSLMKTYVPPDPAKIQAAKDAGNVDMALPGGGKGVRFNFHNYAKPGDLLTVEIDPASNRLSELTVATYIDDPKDAVTLDVRFSSLQDGTGYPAAETLVAKAKNLSVNITNSGYRKAGQ
jgi:hypothetical protein